MRSTLRNGRIAPPRSFREASDRHRQLIHEIARIQAQLEDPTRVLRYPSTKEYDAWRDSAQHALKLFRIEATQLDEWQETPGALLAKAYDVLQTLEDEVDFEPHERALLQRLGRYFAARERMIA